MLASVPVVFLHAFPLGPAMWRSQVAALSGGRVLTPSFPGFGGRSPGGTSLDDFADAVVADMDAAGIGRAVVVGLSMGGYAAFRLHARRPERIAALVLADTKATADDEAARAKRTGQAGRARREGVAWLVDAMVPVLLGETTLTERPSVKKSVGDMIADADPEGVARALEAMRDRPDSTGDLASITVPVLAIAGEEDQVTPVEGARQIAEGVVDGRLVVIPKAGHLSSLEDASAFNSALLSFLER
ncbi:MAG: alpha/beta hydrolase [Gemmatimonadota bacterium]